MPETGPTPASLASSAHFQNCSECLPVSVGWCTRQEAFSMSEPCRLWPRNPVGAAELADKPTSHPHCCTWVRGEDQQGCRVYVGKRAPCWAKLGPGFRLKQGGWRKGGENIWLVGSWWLGNPKTVPRVFSYSLRSAGNFSRNLKRNTHTHPKIISWKIGKADFSYKHRLNCHCQRKSFIKQPVRMCQSMYFSRCSLPPSNHLHSL